MPATDQSRILRDRLQPRIVMLWQALARLQTVVSFMQSGAHPDDETSAMLAVLGPRDGLDLSYCCATRGEGGQNDIGTEAGAALGTLRTAEMERACDVLNMSLYWLCLAPNDPVSDFGFSKSGTDTMATWGRDRLMQRFVRAIRAARPDILCPTFLDIPGQHGHHRAMTEAAHLVMDLAADPSFDTGDQTPWRIHKLYLPAWSGAGQAYDDTLPPPPATLTLEAEGFDPVTGHSYERIGQQSRACHRTQAMGRWDPDEPPRRWPLHLARTRLAGPDDAVTDGLPLTLRDLGMAPVQDHLDAARAAFPDFPVVLREASAALGLLQQSSPPPELAHKVARKISQVSQVIRYAAGAQAFGTLEPALLTAGAATRATISHRKGLAEQAEATTDLPAHWSARGDKIVPGPDALSRAYPETYHPDAPAAPRVALRLTTHGVTSTTFAAFDEPPLVLPQGRAELSETADIVNLAAGHLHMSVGARSAAGSGQTLELDLPEGWRAARTDAGFDLKLPPDVTSGAYVLPLMLDGRPAFSTRIVAHDHAEARALTAPAVLKVQVLDVALPKGRIAYIGAGNDRVDYWLRRLGCDVESLPPARISPDMSLDGFDTLVIGIFAMRFCPGLAQAMPHLHAWVRAGGTLVTLYHRPWDNWDPDTVPPKRLEIGQPSLRWRVTDETAAVTHLSDHPVLRAPNRIGADDWQGWHKERGLYFARAWDDAYVPLIQMADPGEDPHRGALLAAGIGQGRHIHCALILHHQMEHLVPGAFRLMANLVAARG